MMTNARIIMTVTILFTSVIVLYTRFPILHFRWTMLVAGLILCGVLFGPTTTVHEMFESTIVKSELGSILDKFAGLPLYASDKIGSGMDALVTAMQSSLGKPGDTTNSNVTVLSKIMFDCPNTAEPMCDGRKLDENAYSAFLSDIKSIKPLFTFMTADPTFEPALAYMLQT
jgi:hypothetical protein